MTRKALISLVTSATLVMVQIPAMAADSKAPQASPTSTAQAPSAPLAPGGAAGVQQAQQEVGGIPLLWAAGIVTLATLGVLVASNNSSEPGAATGATNSSGKP
jgi:hypothetical protein